jgi:ankyrin repeat protein
LFSQPPRTFFEKFKISILEADIDEIEVLIDEANRNNYDLNQYDEKTKYTLLHFTVTKTTQQNEEEMMRVLQLLLKVGCDLNQPALDRLANTPIHSACRRGLPNLLEWLLRHGATSNVCDARTFTSVFCKRATRKM